MIFVIIFIFAVIYTSLLGAQLMMINPGNFGHKGFNTENVKIFTVQ